ncbi:MAG TPA: lipopolysaccharide assembly protein LapA domain-containing protein [Burkholderiales bacterium]|nr:lipopolysaccharide assembly protein LapA domain-containing protein [Burkholderiales bacterium]
MRIVTWTIRLVVFVLLVAFAAKNVEPIALRFYFGLELKAPLVLALLAAFALGALFGVAALLRTIVRQRREISLLRKPVEPAPPPVTPL